MLDLRRRRSPGVPFSTRKPRMPSAVIAQTTAEVGDRPVGDPHLGAVQHPVRAALLGVGLHVGRIRAAVRLGEAEAADQLAARHARQVLLLLLLGAEGVDRVHAQRGLHGHEAADAGVAALQFLADQPVADGIQAGAVVAVRARSPAGRVRRASAPARFGKRCSSKAFWMIGSTSASTRRATESCTRRSSSVSARARRTGRGDRWRRPSWRRRAAAWATAHLLSTKTVPRMGRA